MIASADELAEVINRTAKRGGAVVIPAFAVDRTQLLLYYLGQLEAQQRIPLLPVYVDSPMAMRATGQTRSMWRLEVCMHSTPSSVNLLM